VRGWSGNEFALDCGNAIRCPQRLMQDSTSLDNLLYDPRDPAVMANPFPAYSRLQTEDPVHWNPVLKSWVVTRYADVRSVLLHDAMSVNKLNAFYQSLPPIDAARMRDIVHARHLWHRRLTAWKAILRA